MVGLDVGLICINTSNRNTKSTFISDLNKKLNSLSINYAKTPTKKVSA